MCFGIEDGVVLSLVVVLVGRLVVGHTDVRSRTVESDSSNERVVGVGVGRSDAIQAPSRTIRRAIVLDVRGRETAERDMQAGPVGCWR
jgi:hypothetical protein